MVILSFICALILSILASVLAEPEGIAKEIDRSKQMMIAAKILDHDGYFLVTDPRQTGTCDVCDRSGNLVPESPRDFGHNATSLMRSTKSAL